MTFDEAAQRLERCGVTFASIQFPAATGDGFRVNTREGDGWRIGEGRPTLEEALLDAIRRREKNEAQRRREAARSTAEMMAKLLG